MWTPAIDGRTSLKYLAIVDALELDVRGGRLAPGERLPPQRAIAEAIGVDLTTVTRAFNEARKRGLIEAQAGRGTFVREHEAPGGRAPAITRSPLVDLSMNIPPQPADADFREAIPRAIAAILASPRGLLTLHYQDSTGTPHDREAATAWLSRRIAGVSADRVILAAGAQAALFAVCAHVLARGDRLAAGAVTYPGLKAVAAQQGLVLQALAMDAQGIVPDAFEQACKSDQRPRALYVIPTIDNPTTATLPLERRHALVQIARRHGVAIIEDDPYGPLRGGRDVTLAELAGDVTWHIATLSKCATPALRVAYVVAPSAAQAIGLAGVLRASILMAPPLMSALATRWIDDGTLDAITASIRAENRARQALAASLLNPRDCLADPEGHHLWLRLPDHWRATAFADHADRAGVSIVPVSAFAIDTPAAESVRISLGVAPDRGALEDGLLQLSGLLGHPALATRAVV